MGAFSKTVESAEQLKSLMHSNVDELYALGFSITKDPDFVQEIIAHWFSIVDSYNPSLALPSTFLVFCGKNKLYAMNKSKRKRAYAELSDVHAQVDNGYKDVDNSDLVAKILDAEPDHRVKETVRRVLLEGKTQKEVAKELGVSNQGVSQRIERFFQNARRNCARLGV